MLLTYTNTIESADLTDILKVNSFADSCFSSKLLFSEFSIFINMRFSISEHNKCHQRTSTILFLGYTICPFFMTTLKY